MPLFVSFAEAVRALKDEARTLALPERGLFGVVEGDPAAMTIVASALDAGARISNRTDDVAEVLDGLHEELRARGSPVSFALVVVEDDALAFLGLGNCAATVHGEGYTRRVLAPYA